MKNTLTTKKLILDAIKTQLEKENVQKLLLVFSLHSDNYSCHVKALNNEKAIKFKIEPKETSMIKRMFVSKIVRKIENVENYKDIIITVEIDSDEFEIYLNDQNNEVTKLEI